jgi:Chaperonin 10 Kd subunit
MSLSSKIHVERDWRSIRPTKDNVLVTDMHFGDRTTANGIIIISDDKEERGIRPRWARVLAVGPLQEDVAPGEYILVSHGRWTRGIDMTDPETQETTTIRMVDPRDMLMASPELPVDLTISGGTSHQRLPPTPDLTSH